MAYEVFAGDRQMVADRINGSKVFGPIPNSGVPVGGLTLIVGGTTVTFSGSAGDVLSMSDIIDEINASAWAGTASKRSLEQGTFGPVPDGSGRPDPAVGLVLTDEAGYTVDKDGTANPYLRIPTSADTVVIAAPTAAQIIAFGQGLTVGHYSLIIELP